MRICFMATCSWDGNFPEQQGKTTANKQIEKKFPCLVFLNISTLIKIHLFHVKNALGNVMK